MIVKTMTPIASGNQPPSVTLTMFAPKNARSEMSSGITSANTASTGQRQRSRATTASSVVVIAIVAVTATPYAAARLLDDPKAMTSPIAANIRIQFTDGM